MFDVKPGPLEGSERLMLSLGRSRGQNIKLGPLEGPKYLMLSLGPSRAQNV